MRVGLYCLQKAQHPLDAKWVCIADFTIQIGSKKALIVLRVPLAILRQGKALTLKQVEVIGLSLSQTWNGELVNTYLLSLFERCGWPAHVVSDCGSDIKGARQNNLSISLLNVLRSALCRTQQARPLQQSLSF